MVELNTLIGLPVDFDTTSLKIGETFTIKKERERAFPLHIAMLVVDKNWNFYGYAVAHSLHVSAQMTEITFEMLSLFTAEEQSLYKAKFTEAAIKTGEVK